MLKLFILSIGFNFITPSSFQYDNAFIISDSKRLSLAASIEELIPGSPLMLYFNKSIYTFTNSPRAFSIYLSINTLLTGVKLLAEFLSIKVLTFRLLSAVSYAI